MLIITSSFTKEAVRTAEEIGRFSPVGVEQLAHLMIEFDGDANVAACRFYARQGRVLGAIHRLACPDLLDEAQLLRYGPLAEPVTT